MQNHKIDFTTEESTERENRLFSIEQNRLRRLDPFSFAGAAENSINRDFCSSAYFSEIEISNLLTHPNNRLVSAIISNPSITLTQHHISIVLLSNDPTNIESLITHRLYNDFNPSKKLMDELIYHEDVHVRYSIFSKITPLSKQHVAVGLKDSNDTIRNTVIRRAFFIDYFPTNKEIEDLLTHTSPGTRYEMAHSVPYLSARQLKRGLNDTESDVAYAFKFREQFFINAIENKKLKNLYKTTHQQPARTL